MEGAMVAMLGMMTTSAMALLLKRLGGARSDGVKIKMMMRLKDDHSIVNDGDDAVER